MTHKERQQLRLQWKMDPQGFEKRAHEAMSKLLELETNLPELDERTREEREAIFKENWQFLAQVLETLKSKEFILFHEKVATAYTRLFSAHVGRDRLNAKRDGTEAKRNLGDLIPAAMIKETVVAMFPEAANATPQQYSKAFRKIGLPPFKKKPRSK
jgi:hypothetical protein